MKKILTIFFFLLGSFFQTQNAQALPNNNELRIGISQEFETLNPVSMQMVMSTYISNMVNHSIITMNADWQWECLLCVEIPTMENGKAHIIEEGGKKKLVLDWEIKDNAKWGDGQPVTGKDVQLGWEVGKSPNVMVGDKLIYNQVEAVIVDPKNPKKFSLKYTDVKYDATYLGTFYILPDHLERAIWESAKNTLGQYEKLTKYSTDSTNPGLYDGPYKVTEIKLGSHVMVEPNPLFYGEPAKIKKIIFKLIPDTATLEANLVSGTVDMISESSMKLDQALSLEKHLQADPTMQQNFKVNFRDGPIFEHIDLQLKNPMLQDVRVRQALMYAMDRERLTQALFEGRQKRAHHLVHPSDPYYTEDGITIYDYNPQKAEALLDEAGWKKGSDGFRYKDNQKLSFQLMTTAQDKSRELVQVFLQNEWKKIGIDITIKNEPARVFFGETVHKSSFPAMAMYAWTSNPDNPPHAQLHSSQRPTPENGYSGQNRAFYSNPEVDKAVTAVYTEMDMNKRKELMKTILQHFTQDVPILPLYFRSDISVTPTNLKNYRMTGHQFYSTLWVNKWTLE